MNLNLIFFPTLILTLLIFHFSGSLIKRCKRTEEKRFLFIAAFITSIPGILITLYYLHWFDRAKWFYQLRSLPLIELTVAGLGLLFGVLAESTRYKLVSKTFLIIILVITVSIPYLKPVVVPLSSDKFKNKWQDGICMQSTVSSCGPASAATILRFFNIEATEQEIAGECYTYLGGTENWYLTRALRRRGLRVEYRIADGFPKDLNLPAIAGVKIGNNGHFIAVLSETNQEYITGDPLKGRQKIAKNQIENDFNFTGFFMEIQKAN
ncbi:MAG: cysteine peptidase family C39 domain-containing protein [Phycisphaerae bacterium]|jgi:predicted double-glycine peptidase